MMPKVILFFLNKKLILVKNFQKIKNKIDIQNLLDYIKNPVDFTCLIFIEEERDKFNVFYKSISSLKTVVEFYSPFPQQLPFWISNLVQSKGKQITPVASNLLIERVGNNLQKLVNEIEKLILYVGENTKINLKDVEDVTSDIKINTIFELCSAIANKQKKKAILILEKLSKTEEPLKILFFLTQQLRKIWRAQNYFKNGIEEKKVATLIHVHPMFMKEIINATTKFNFE
ncbi:MAG: DNA polymerase III subunit delta, partial [bacterium]